MEHTIYGHSCSVSCIFLPYSELRTGWNSKLWIPSKASFRWSNQQEVQMRPVHSNRGIFCQTYGELAQNLWVHKDKGRQTLESYGIAKIMVKQTIGNPYVSSHADHANLFPMLSLLLKISKQSAGSTVMSLLDVPRYPKTISHPTIIF